MAMGNRRALVEPARIAKRVTGGNHRRAGRGVWADTGLRIAALHRTAPTKRPGATHH